MTSSKLKIYIYIIQAIEAMIGIGWIDYNKSSGQNLLKNIKRRRSKAWTIRSSVGNKIPKWLELKKKKKLDYFK